MKINFIIMLIMFSTVSFSQNKIEIKSGTDKFSVGKADVLIANIYDADVEYVKKSWKKLIKRYSGSVKMGSEIFADDVTIKKLSTNTADIYAKINSKKDNIVEIIVAVDLGGAFLSKSAHPDKFKVFEEILKTFATEVSKEAVREEIDTQEKILSKMEKGQEKLVSDKEKLQSEIEKYKQKIIDNEKEIEQNTKAQEEKQKLIKAQKAVILKLSDKERAIK